MKALIVTLAIGCITKFAICQQPAGSQPPNGLKKANAPREWSDRNNHTVFRSDSISKNDLTFVFLVQDSSFSTETQKRLTDAFFTVYPQEVKRFNQQAAKKVICIIDPSYDGVAATSGNVIRCSPVWFQKHPEDIDVITHEAMHIVQSYSKGHTPGWLTEGIADYVRYKYGVNNEKAGWQLPAFSDSHHYTRSYRITARFFAWVEKNVDKNIIDEMNKAAFDGTYEEALWVKYTGKTVDQLWASYSQSPAL